MLNIMIDLETLDTEPTAAILSIGAVYFDETGLGETFYGNISPESCKLFGLTESKATLAFWERQSEEAKQSLLKDINTLPWTLGNFYNFVTTNKNKTKVWGNGSPFDNVILRNAYKACNITPPWRWWNDRCYRTFNKEIPVDYESENELEHNALADAIYQAKKAVLILKKLKELK